jgi:hypothetical protein
MGGIAAAESPLQTASGPCDGQVTQIGVARRPPIRNRLGPAGTLLPGRRTGALLLVRFPTRAALPDLLRGVPSSRGLSSSFLPRGLLRPLSRHIPTPILALNPRRANSKRDPAYHRTHPSCSAKLAGLSVPLDPWRRRDRPRRQFERSGNPIFPPSGPLGRGRSGRPRSRGIDLSGPGIYRRSSISPSESLCARSQPSHSAQALRRVRVI